MPFVGNSMLFNGVDSVHGELLEYHKRGMATLESLFLIFLVFISSHVAERRAESSSKYNLA